MINIIKKHKDYTYIHDRATSREQAFYFLEDIKRMAMAMGKAVNFSALNFEPVLAVDDEVYYFREVG